MKLWDKGQDTNKFVELFTVGNDREMDLLLAEHDVLGSMAHAIMLNKIGLLSNQEIKTLHAALLDLIEEIEKGNFKIEEGAEDVHSQVEVLLTNRLGDVGKKIHSGRSRNDQVLVDLRLFMRQKVKDIVEGIQILFNKLIDLSNEHKEVLIPGYTHLQVAMPSSLGLWFGAYAESLVDDLQLLLAAYKIINQNPLGSAAGYGSSFPLKRKLTTDLLGFYDLSYNVVYAQMSRGKSEKSLSFALSSVASTLAKFSMDAILFMSQNFGFISFPEELTTGSSIMPHKKNPDMFELIRAKCNKIQNVPNEIGMITGNLTSGYHRDFQILKESIFPAIDQLEQCIAACDLMLEGIVVNENVLDDEKYKYIFSVEEANKMVLNGIPFRDAYRQVGEQIKKGQFNPEKKVTHTHEGSIGNLCNKEISEKFKRVINQFDFRKFENALNNLKEYKNKK